MSPLSSFRHNSARSCQTILVARGECVRLINFVKGAELNYNTISDCGIHDYTFGWGSGNGEGIYIGTWASQVTNQRVATNEAETVTGQEIKAFSIRRREFLLTMADSPIPRICKHKTHSIFEV